MSPDYHKAPSNDTTSFSMGGKNPIFFAPSSFTVGHKLQENMSLEAFLSAKQLGRGPLQMVDFKEVGGGDQGMQERVLKRQLRYSNCINYEAAEALTGEDQVSMDDEGGEYGGGAISGGDKKGTRRLAYDQVKALEKAFEVENRLEPERKVRLASELGLQPRQVAVWFQNRRARWKTKQMERDFTLLKNKFEVLKADRDKLLQEKAHLQAELARLKGHPVESKQEAPEGDQDSPTLASCSLVVDDAPNQANVTEEHVEEAPPSDHQKHKINDDSLSSTEDSDNYNGAIEDSSSILQGQASSTKALHDEPDFYPNHWRLVPPPSHPLYKANIKNEGEWENGENGSSSMPIDWYNW